MKKYIFAIAGLLLINCLIIMSCKKKKDDTITPGFKEETGTASNPDPNNVTVTGQTPTNNVPTNNSNVDVGGAGWSNASCASTNSLYLSAQNGDTKVRINFGNTPTFGTYTLNIATYPNFPNAVSMVVENAPNQPAGVVWYGKSGKIQLQVNLNAINATILGDGIFCEQASFQFPRVTVKGTLGCN